MGDLKEKKLCVQSGLHHNSVSAYTIIVQLYYSTPMWFVSSGLRKNTQKSINILTFSRYFV